MADKNRVPLQVFVPLELREALKNSAEKSGKSMAEFIRETLQGAAKGASEKSLEATLQKVLARIEAVIKIQKSVEDDEMRRRSQDRDLILNSMAENFGHVVEAATGNATVLQALVDGLTAQEASNARTFAGLARRESDAIKMLVALLHTATPQTRERWRDIERGVSDGRKITEFVVETLKKV